MDGSKEIVELQQEALRLERLKLAKERLKKAQMTEEELYKEKRDRADKYNKARKEEKVKETLEGLWKASEGVQVDKELLVQLAAGVGDISKI